MQFYHTHTLNVYLRYGRGENSIFISNKIDVKANIFNSLTCIFPPLMTLTKHSFQTVILRISEASICVLDRFCLVFHIDHYLAIIFKMLSVEAEPLSVCMRYSQTLLHWKMINYRFKYV